MDIYIYIIDTILVIPILCAIFSGYKQGVWVQLGGIVGVILGIWIGFHFGRIIGEFFNLTGQSAYVVGFITAIVLVLLSVALVSHLVKGLFRVSGLSLIDHIGGVILSLFKVVIVLSLIVALFDNLNSRYSWVEKSYIDSSFLYIPMKKSSDLIFPFVESISERLFNTEIITE